MDISLALLMLKFQSTEKVNDAPGLMGFGGTMRMLVSTTTCLSGLPATSFTAVILCPPSNFIRTLIASSALYDIPEMPEVVRDNDASEVGA